MVIIFGNQLILTFFHLFVEIRIIVREILNAPVVTAIAVDLKALYLKLVSKL